MREPVIDRFPKAPGLPRNIDAYLKRVNDAYVTDAYHSLSIEGYRVTPDLIERVRSGRWNPEENEGDREQRNAMAARGYWQAFQAVQKSIGKVLGGKSRKGRGRGSRDVVSGNVRAERHRRPAKTRRPRRLPQWPGLYPQSMHVPLNRDAVRDAMPAFFDLLRKNPTRRSAWCSGISFSSTSIPIWTAMAAWAVPDEPDDGVGRISVDSHTGNGPQDIHGALEKASVGEDIAPFADFLAGLVKEGLAGEPLPAVPKASL